MATAAAARPSVRSSRGLDRYVEGLKKNQPVPNRTEQIHLGKAVRRWLDWEGGPDQAPPGVQRAGKRAMDRLVTGNIRLVFRQARHVCKRFCRIGEHTGAGDGAVMDRYLEDAVQAGTFGLISAARKYDPETGYSFATYAEGWIRSALQREFLERENSLYCSHHLYALGCRARAHVERMSAQLGRVPSEDELVQEMIARTARKTSPERVKEAIRAVNLIGSVGSLDSQIRGCESPEMTVGNSLSDDKYESPEEYAVRTERVRRVREAVEMLPDKPRAVLEMHLDHGVSYRKAGEILGCNPFHYGASVRGQYKRLRALLGDLEEKQ